MDINKNLRQNDAVKYYVNKEKGIAAVIAGYLDVCRISDKDKPIEETTFYPLLPLLEEVCNKMDACSMESFMYGFNDLSKEYDLRNTQLYVVSAYDQILIKQDFHNMIKNSILNMLLLL